MITRFASLTSRLAVACALLFTIAACGGGGGGSDGSFLPDDGGGTNYKVELNLTDADGNPTSTVTAASPATLTALVTRKGNKQPVASVVVNLNADIGSILPDSGTALTDSNGQAIFQIAADDSLGGGTLTATVENPDEGGSPFTATLSFQVGQAGLSLGHFEDGSFINGEIGIDTDELAVGGSALLRFAVVDESGNLATTAETIKLQSGCSLSGLAQLPAQVESVNGQATATYTASGCGGQDEITAALVSNAAEATGTINVAPPEADVIEFVSVIPETGVIALKGTGTATRPETATISFRVISGASSPEDPGTALAGIAVKFSLSSDVGGITLKSDSGTTDSEGIVKATVQSGNVATSVSVNAVIQLDSGEGPGTASPPIVVSTGLPDQNSISVSSSLLNVQGGLDFDGKTAEITVRMADIFNNPVADGTSAVFTTEYGVIQSSCVTVGGACSVTWTSQNPRLPVFNQDLVKTIAGSDTYDCPSHNGFGGPCPDDLGAIRGLRTTILVTAVGEEYFNDSNGNGLYDQGEPFENLPEAFVDYNEDGVYTPVLGPQCPNPPSSTVDCEAAGAEEDGKFIDFNGDGQYSLNNDPAIYNGSLCPEAGDIAGWCSRELVNVRADIVLIMSSEGSFGIELVNQLSRRVVTGTDEGQRYVVYISDFYNNRPAGGVTVEVEPGAGCEVLTPTSFTVVDSNATGSFSIPLETAGDGGQSSTVTIKVGDSNRTFGCRAPEDPDDNPGGGVGP